MTDALVRLETTLAGSAAALLEPVLTEAAGPGARAVSLTLDYGAPGVDGEAVVVEAWTDRATRTLAFLGGRVVRVADGAALVTGSAVFRRVAEGS